MTTEAEEIDLKVAGMNKSKILEAYSTCDISDALGKLKLVGHLSGIRLFTRPSSRVSGLAYTADFCYVDPLVPKPALHHVDSCPAGSFLLIRAPLGAPNAVFGGLMALRCIAVACVGVAVEGNIRDIDEIEETGLNVYASGNSTMGAAPICQLASVGEPIEMAALSKWPVLVKTGDVIVADRDGVVRVSSEDVDRVALLCASLKLIDRRCREDLKAGSTVESTFRRHRQ